MKIIKYLTLSVLCFSASILICMKIVDDILVQFAISEYMYLLTRVILAILLYFLVLALINKKLSDKEINIVSITYIILVITLTLFKGDFGGGRSNINLNPLEIINDFKLSDTSGLLLIANFFVYMPIGIYIKKIFKNKNIKILLLCSLIYFLAIESIQYLFKLGFFDINDILLNITGFSIGIFIYKKYSNIKESKLSRNQNKY